jgi:hypothetical protein
VAVSGVALWHWLPVQKDPGNENPAQDKEQLHSKNSHRNAGAILRETVPSDISLVLHGHSSEWAFQFALRRPPARVSASASY